MACADRINALASSLLPQTAVFGRAGRQNSHWLYVSHGLKTRKFTDPRSPKDQNTLVEIRSTGSQTVFPPSVHVTGEIIAWSESRDPYSIDCNQLICTVERLAAASLMARYWPGDGAHHDAQLTLCACLVRAGWQDDEIATLVAAVIDAADGEADYKKRRATAADCRARLSRGEPVRGIPALIDLFGEQVVNRLVQWLKLETDPQDQKTRNASAPEGSASSPEGSIHLDFGSDIAVTRHLESALQAEYGLIIFYEGEFYFFSGTHWRVLDQTSIRRKIHDYDGASFPNGRSTFIWNGKLYNGKYEALITPELWERVQDVMSGPRSKRRRQVKHDFTFSGLVSCGHCGCAVVAERKKERYVYYHCTGYRGKCGEPYVREEVLEEQFAASLDRPHFDNEVIDWVRTALIDSHAETQRFHAKEIARLRAAYDKAQGRLDRVYLDKVDGLIDSKTFERLSQQMRDEQAVCERELRVHQDANQTYFDEGVRLMELAQRAGTLFRTQTAAEKRKLLAFVVSNCTWANGQLTVQFKQPFDLIAETALADEQHVAVAEPESAISEKWLPGPEAILPCYFVQLT